jgi:hypothetical protein
MFTATDQPLIDLARDRRSRWRTSGDLRLSP